MWVVRELIYDSGCPWTTTYVAPEQGFEPWTPATWDWLVNPKNHGRSDQPYGGEREEPARENCKWKDINAYNGDEPTEKLPFPTINDKKRELPILWGLLDPSEKDEKGMPVTARVVFIFGPDKKLKLSILYPATTGRNFDEILRVIKSLQLTATKRVATLVDWKEGESVMVLPIIAEEEAKSLFPKGVFTKDLPSARSTSIIPRSLNSLCGSSDTVDLRIPTDGHLSLPSSIETSWLCDHSQSH